LLPLKFVKSPIPTLDHQAEFYPDMPTKKQPTRTEREVAARKNHPIAKSNRPARGQNAELEPPRRKDRDAL
jgi:hypothetical protein